VLIYIIQVMRESECREVPALFAARETMDRCVTCQWFKWTMRDGRGNPTQGICLPHAGGCLERMPTRAVESNPPDKAAKQ